jgi:hypothetical protein
MEQHTLRLVPAAAALVATALGCYASHRIGDRDGSDGGIPTDAAGDAEPPEPCPDVRPVDVSTCGGPGTDACGCAGDLRRCDTCDQPCPEGTQCWMPQGVCKAFDLNEVGSAPFDDICVFRTDDTVEEVMGLRFAPRGRTCASGRPCVVDRGQAGTLDDPFEGVCLTSEYCQAIGAIGPLSAAVRCLDSNGDPWDGTAPDDPCPSEPIDGAWCGPVLGGLLCEHERAITAHASCVGVGAERGVGICAPTDQRCRRGDAELSAQTLRGCLTATRGDPCICMAFVGESFSERFPSAVRATTCAAYARLYPDEIECLTPEELGARGGG